MILLIALTYKESNIPDSPEEAQRQMRNFLRRVKRFHKRQGLPELKYVAVTKAGKRTGQIYHHIVMSVDIVDYRIASFWDEGYIKVLLLSSVDITNIAGYLAEGQCCRWCASRSLGGSGKKQRSIKNALEGFFPGIILHEKAYKRSVMNDREAGKHESI